MSDKTKILQWFKTHKYITCYDAVFKLGVMNLRSRVCEINGIVSEMIDITRADGVKTKVARYHLITKKEAKKTGERYDI